MQQVINAVIQNLMITNGEDGKSVGIFLQLRDSNGNPSAFQSVVVKAEDEQLEHNIRLLAEFAADMDYVNISSDEWANTTKTNYETPLDGGLIITCEEKENTAYLVGPRWNRVG